MAQILCLVILSISSLLAQVSGVAFVNNVTVPSDILSNIFFEEIQKTTSLLDVSVRGPELYDSQKCITGLREIAKRFPSLETLPFFDSWGKLPSGILVARLQSLGNFDQCLRASITLKEVGLVHGQYCFISIPLINDKTLNTPTKDVDSQLQSRMYEELVRISMAICVPDTCEPNFLKSIFQNAINSSLSNAFSGFYIDRCSTARRPDFKPIDIFGIVVFSIVGALMVFSTVYDGYTTYFQKKAIPILLAFSIYTNGRKLFTINTTKSSNSIECLTGIRVLSMVWVVVCHTYSLSPMSPMLNIIDLIKWFDKASAMHILMATISVDTFLFISGLLVGWLGFRELDKTNGKLNVKMMYFHRYVRLTPPVIALMLYFLCIQKFVGVGPYKEIFEIFHDGCKTNWWSTLLYVQNYANPNRICVPQTWYLAVDTQLYIISPLILISLWKWGKKFVPVMFVLSAVSIGCVIATFCAEGYKQFPGVLDDNQMKLTYEPTHTRYTIWLIGIGLGYFIYINRQKSMRLPKLVQFFGWILSFVIIFAIIYGPYFTISSNREQTVLEVAIYDSMKRVGWGVVLSWLIFTCHFGFGGIINSFLCHPLWQPLGRLTYCMYLVHMAVQTFNYGTTRTEVYYSDYTMILWFWSAFGISLTAAVVLTLSFEAPTLALEKFLLSSAKPKSNEKQDIGWKQKECLETPQNSA